MSKLLKFVVNLFLIATILTAVAILVPPLAGVTTTIVDTPSMNTNLPLGSITYSTDINVYDIKPGDEILKENDSSTYAYIIREADPDNGRFVAVSSADENGAAQEVILRNTVSKVAVVVPFIGYIVMAMHSIEGIVIIVLVVVLMIILFILSELWKHSPDDEEETEEAGAADGGETPQVTAREETDIDTDAIREAVEMNHSAGLDEEAGKDDAAALAGGAAAAAALAAPTAEIKAVAEPETMADAAAGTAVPVSAELDEEADKFNYASLTLPEDPMSRDDGVPAGGTETLSAAESGNSGDAFKEVLPETAGESGAQALSDLADEIERDKDAPLPVIRDPEELEMAEAEAAFFAGPQGEAAGRKEAADAGAQPDAERFTPVARPALEEILGDNRNSGREPVVKKDDKSGISIVDMSELL